VGRVGVFQMFKLKEFRGPPSLSGAALAQGFK
jgi:hypothetical protein